MESDVQGCSTCPPGQEQWEEHELKLFSGGVYLSVHYIYQTPAGELYSCVAPTLEKARARRDKWLALKVVK